MLKEISNILNGIDFTKINEHNIKETLIRSLQKFADFLSKKGITHKISNIKLSIGEFELDEGKNAAYLGITNSSYNLDGKQLILGEKNYLLGDLMQSIMKLQ